jgi:Sec-independent protein translocase protein TatA
LVIVFGKGIKGFRSGLGGKDEDDQANAKPQEPNKQIPPIVEDATSSRRDRTGVDQ